LLPDTRTQVTHAITINATPEKIWPWIVQMGCGRGGFYSLDTLDNAGVPSAREIHPELQKIEVGQIIPAMPDSDLGFEVLSVDEPRTLVLGGLFDPESKRQLPFSSPRPERYWQVTCRSCSSRWMTARHDSTCAHAPRSRRAAGCTRCGSGRSTR
jgi:hypothetical protein